MKISIIIPVYNAEKYLKQCLDSVVNQTLKDIEIICIDDGSTDNSLRILKEYAVKDKRIHILQEENCHAGVARNNGISVARGEFVHFLDADDWIKKDAYEKLYKIIKDTDADFVKFKAYSYNNETNEITTRPYLDIEWVNKKFFENYLNIIDNTTDIVRLPDSPWSGIYRLDFLRNNKIYFDNFICANDVGFFYRCIINAKKVYLSSERLLYYRENLKTSLIAKRAENFNCQISLYEVVKKESKALPNNIRFILTDKIIESICDWYNVCLTEYNLTPKVIKNIKNEMKKFIQQSGNDRISILTYRKYKRIKDDFTVKKQIRQIFSITNIGTHKIICILGVKLKIRLKTLKERENSVKSAVNKM